MTRAEKLASLALDKMIERIFYRHCSNIPINVMDIPKVFAAGRAAAMQGTEQAITDAVVSTVQTLRRDI